MVCAVDNGQTLSIRGYFVGSAEGRVGAKSN